MDVHTTHWRAEELRKIAETDDLHISPFREDDVTYGSPTWVWSVVVDDVMYVRGYNGSSRGGIKRRFIRRPVAFVPPA